MAGRGRKTGPSTADAGRFIQAVHDNNIYLVKNMISFFGRAIVDTADHRDETPLTTAAWLGHYDIVSLLISNGANIEKTDSMGRTPLLCAIHTNKIETVRLLLENGADTTARDENGRTSPMLARHCGHNDIVNLLRAGVTPHEQPQKNTAHIAQLEKLRSRRPQVSPFKKSQPKP